MTTGDFSAVVVTRGDCDIAPVLYSLRNFKEVIVWDNSARSTNAKVYGRYLGCREASSDLLYVQDDDCITDSDQIIANYNPSIITTNMPDAHYTYYSTVGLALVGFGAAFHRSMIDFRHYWAVFPMDDLFLRECDRIFTGLGRCHRVNVPVKHLGNSSTPDRMWKERRHGEDLREIIRRVSVVKSNGRRHYESLHLPTQR